MIQVHNTLSRRLEPLETQRPGEVGIYSCGVTVYDLSHVGHARSAMVFDVMVRYLRARGYRVKFVRNFTDIDDKIIRRANAEGVPASVVSERYITEFRTDMASIGVHAADAEPKATEHVAEMIEIIEGLVAKGIAYVVDGDVYFEVRRFPAYGKLSGKNLDDLLAGARVDVDERKRDPRDFALWKSSKPGEPTWPSPWGPGRPGWHIECSAMAMKYLGKSFEIHGGGDDLIFPHHECEIAQTEAVTGVRFAAHWLHNGMVNMGAEKMSKSIGNILTIKEIVKRHHRDALRLWLLNTHYRNQIEFSEARLEENARARERFESIIADVRKTESDAFFDVPGPARFGDPAPWTTALAALDGSPLRDVVATACERFERAMDDDFSTPEARGALFTLVRDLDAFRREGGDARAFALGVRVLVTLGRTLGLFEALADASGPPAEVEQLVRERTDARARRDFKRADELRQEIQQGGWALEDTAAGPRVTRLRS
jgi:cysteinyl-tRNA synthetase